MHLTISAFIAALAAAATTAAEPVSPRQDILIPWQLSSIISFAPSGRPGSYPWQTITANLTDPNELILGTGSDGKPVTLPANEQASNCEAKWIAGETPFGRSWPCDFSGDGYWVLEILKTKTGSFGTHDFDMKITRVAETIYLGSAFKRTFAAEAHFEAGNIGPGYLSGSCGGSGVCSWSLKEELRPLAIQQRETTQ